MRILLVLLTLVASILSGCASDDNHDGMALDENTYMLHMDQMPTAAVQAGSTFTSRMMVGGHMEHGSDHIGAHYWNATQSDPDAAIGKGTACVHVAGDLPETYLVACPAPTQPGTYYLRGHARITEDGTTFNWWSNEHTFTVV